MVKITHFDHYPCRKRQRRLLKIRRPFTCPVVIVSIEYDRIRLLNPHVARSGRHACVSPFLSLCR